MRIWLYLMLVACDQGVVRAPSTEPRAPGPDLIVREVPSSQSPIVREVPPPPPPPPPAPSLQPPPPRIATFLRDHAEAPGPWRVTLRDGKRRVKLPDGVARDFVARLALDSSYIDGDIGCVGDEVDVRIARGDGKLDFTYDCGHVFLDAAKHDGEWTLFSPEMVEYFEALRS